MDDNENEQPPEAQLPRKRGRPKGLPKTGGRKKGTKNWTHPEIRDELLEKSSALDVLADIVAGRQLYAGSAGSVGKPGWRYPTLQQRLQALQILLAKVVSDLKATEVTGAGGEPLITASNRSVAVAIMDVLKCAGGNEDVVIRDSNASVPQLEGGAEGRGDCIEIPTGSNISDPSENTTSENISDPSENGPTENIGECHMVGCRGATIEFVEIEGTGRKKWEVRDGWGELHSYRRQREDAETLALRLNGPNLEMKRGKENDTPRQGNQ